MAMVVREAPTRFRWLRRAAQRLLPLKSGWRARLLAARRRHDRALLENSQRYRAIVETAVDAIVSIDKFGRVRSFNRAAERIFGYAAAEVVGRNINILMHEPQRSAHDDYIRAYCETRKPNIIGIGREVVGRRKDGSTVEIDLSVAEWHDVDGEPRFTGMMRDVTARNRQAQELQRAGEAAEQARLEAEAANQAKTDFLATMSHEIRTPLMSISGFADLLTQAGRLTKEQRRYIDLIRTANGALMNIVNDVLDFSKVEAGQLQLQPHAFSLSDLIHDTVAIVRPIVSKKPLALKWTLDRRTPEWVVGDDVRLRQILLNLLNNAIKFTEDGTVTVTVGPKLSHDGSNVVHFAVSDTGIGIAPEHQHRLFRQFSQADGSINRRFGGTGLGLAISKRLVALMDGDIGVVSEVGAGTTIWFTAMLPSTEQPNVAPLADEPIVETAGVHRGKILLVDDLETNREIVSAYLKDGGFDVVPVGSGSEAIDRLQAERFDLVLMDIQMPGMDGVAATRAIREMSTPLSSIPILAMTGNVLPQQVQSFIKAGMNDHVGKPIVRTKLYSTLWRWLPRETANDRAAANVSALFNYAKFEELLGGLGSMKAERTVQMFEGQLRTSFRGNLAEARREAHDLINGAGMLGFESLLALSGALKESTADDAGSLALLTQCQATRDAVLDIIAATILPQLIASNFRKSA